MRLIDSHAHLDAKEFDADLPDVLACARVEGIVACVVPAVEAAGFPKLKSLAQSHPELAPAYGLHPMYLSQHRPEHLETLRHWLEHERPCAVGECGLDHFVEGLDANVQREFLVGQLKLARQFDLPVILHARRALDEVLTLLRRIGGLRGVVHSFSGSREQAEQLWKLGFHLGIGGPVTFERASRLRGLVATMPLEFLLLETDAPDQPDADWRGKRNAPARLSRVLHTIAGLRNESLEAIAERTTRNAVELFDLALPQAVA
ncbi:MAG: TatD family hydrolase [Lysobacteraceae bacterium]